METDLSSYVDLNQLKEECKTLLFETGWDLYSESDGIKAETKHISGSDIKMIRAQVEIKLPIEKVAEFCWELREKLLKKSDSNIGKVVDWEEDKNNRIRETIMQLPWPITSRQSVFLMHRYNDDKGSWIVQKSISNYSKIPVTSDYVRANMTVGIFYFRATDEGHTIFHRLVHVDPNGSVPSTIINLGLGKMASLLTFVRKELQQQK